MPSSPARVEANRKNAQQSTGPKTPEGKAISRANAFKHGLSGDGIVVSEAEGSLVVEVAEQLHGMYNPKTLLGLTMLDRAALQLVRLDRAGTIESAIIDDSVITAVANFDQFRIDYADNLFNTLDANPSAIDELQTFPEGIDRMIAEWTSLAYVEEWTPEALARLGRMSDAGRCTPNVIRSMIPGEIARLEDMKAAIDRKPIEAARKRAAALGLFPTTREAILARRYEAAIERSYHKAMEAFHEAEATEQATETPQAPEPTAADEALASFRPAPPRPQVTEVPTRPIPAPVEPAAVPVAPEPPVDRKRRPDPQKLRAQMDQKRRR